MTTTSESSSDPPSRILLIEDNDANQRLMSDYLIYCGFNVFAVSEGGQFASAMAEFQPEAILLDLKLPDVDGFALLESIQNHPEWRHVPVIVASAKAFATDRQRALSLGAKDYVVKPLQLVELVEIIRREIQAARTADRSDATDRDDPSSA